MQTLADALDEMVSSGRLPPQLALQVLNHFDASMTQALSEHPTGQANIKGHLHTYRGCDGVWTFFVEDANFKDHARNTQKRDVSAPLVKMVLCPMAGTTKKK